MERNCKMLQCRGIGVSSCMNHKVSIQILRKANRILAFIAIGIENMGKEVLLQLFRAWVKLYLEYCTQFWSLEDVNILEYFREGSLDWFWGWRICHIIESYFVEGGHSSHSVCTSAPFLSYPSPVPKPHVFTPQIPPPLTYISWDERAMLHGQST